MDEHLDGRSEIVARWPRRDALKLIAATAAGTGAAMLGLQPALRVTAAGAATPVAGTPVPRRRAFGGGVRNVVLVHGAYADGSCWTEVIERLQAAGLTATAVQNPLTSLADDVAHTRRVLALQDGPAILVGHSFAGTVITEAGMDPGVAGLVYIAARAPDAGEDYTALAKRFPTPPANAGIVYKDGFGALTEDAFLNDFANGVDRVRARALYAVQGRISETLFGDRTSVAAWRSKPSWYAISRQDRTTSPELEHFLATRMHATTIEIDSGHLSLITHPHQVTELILEAAGSTVAARSTSA